MRLSITMTVTAIGSLLFGLAYLLIPEMIVPLYSNLADPSNMWVARYLGATILGFGVVNWLGRNVKSGLALRAIIAGTFTVSAIGFVVSLLETLNGSSNGLVWSTVIIYFLLTIGYGDFIFRTPPPE
jgi:ABC-type spermidine/putrescine transport system permease subunit I